MTEEESKLMEHYGVTAAQETVYLFNGAKYTDLKDALDYARLVLERTNELTVSRR